MINIVIKPLEARIKISMSELKAIPDINSSTKYVASTRIDSINKRLTNVSQNTLKSYEKLWNI